MAETKGNSRLPLSKMLRAYLDENETAFLGHALSPNLHDSFHGIHQMRVAAKRIRSVYRLMEWLAPGQFNARVEMREVRRYFKAAGAVRDIQMRELLLNSYCDRLGFSFPLVDILLRNLRVDAQVRLAKRMTTFKKEMLRAPNTRVRKLLRGMDEALVVEHAVQNVLLRTEEMAVAMPPNYNPERLHRVRILLKENLYVMTQVNTSAAGPLWEAGYVEYVKETGEVAGDWHDADVLLHAMRDLESMEPLAFPEPSQSERLFQEIEDDLRSRLQKYRKRLKRVLAGPEPIRQAEAEAEASVKG